MLAAGPRTRVAPLPTVVSRPAARRGRLRIGYRITGEQLRGTIEVACRTDRMQVPTTLGWADCIDAFTRRLLADTLRAARPVHLPGLPHDFPTILMAY